MILSVELYARVCVGRGGGHRRTVLVKELDLPFSGLRLALLRRKFVLRMQHVVQLVQLACQRVVLRLHRSELLRLYVRECLLSDLTRGCILLDHHAQAVRGPSAESRDATDSVSDSSSLNHAKLHRQAHEAPMRC